MQELLRTALDEVFAFNTVDVRRDGAMIVFRALLAKVKTLSAADHQTFMAAAKADPRVAQEIHEAQAAKAEAEETLKYWQEVLG